MTKQEMFDKAVAGLASQGFWRCMDEAAARCVYTSTDGTRHCAWGWVDPSVPATTYAGVGGLCELGVGIAASLTSGDLNFAGELQAAHDHGRQPRSMVFLLRGVAVSYGLSTSVLDLHAVEQP